jgi:hypothetical protein
MKPKPKNRRAAFTLVEMLVATALIMFIMLILSEAFVAGLNAFRTLKGIGDAEERIRIAVTPLREDLRGDHFDGRRRLSDPMFWNQGSPREGFVNVTQGFFPTSSPTAVPAAPVGMTITQTITVNPIALSPTNPMTNGFTWAIHPNSILGIIDAAGGFEEVVVLSNPPPTANTFTANFTPGPNGHPAPLTIRVIGQLEGFDADLVPVRRATDQILHMAVKLRGNRQENFFTAHLPGAVPAAPVPPPPPPLLSPFFAMLPTGNPNPNYAPTTFFDQAVDARFQDPVPNTYLTGYKTQWAEIAYFLWPNGTFTPNGVPLFALYRAEFKVVPDNRYINGQVNPLGPQPSPAPGVLPPISSVPIQFNVNVNSWNLDGYSEMSAGVTGFGNPPTPVYQFYNPSDLAGNPTALPPIPPSRVFSNFYNSSLGAAWRGNPASGLPFDGNNPTAVSNWSATLIATDVVSFDVQILSPQSGVTDFTDVPNGVFDTAMQQQYTINAVKITLRVRDLKTRQTRQVSVIQDM